ncbi:amidohydrolase family protein [Paenibacillus lycopersici]|uniref:Amidohydrolase family protein n=1 Tax=Paenibacillus lycopersici TaxID=2704462 RepID=A0A6C0G370_9BACL|nr:TatD family hydrolase [Paenibacillus lycopersici]QHT63307.1 amidohydrolase family protein [Paenibacillus lycopersici]
MIIDAHAHLGWDSVFDEDFTLPELLDKHVTHGVTATILQPASCHDLDTVTTQHNRISEVMAAYPGQFYGMANPNPHLADAVYESEVRRCVEELGFVGLKLHTFAHAVNPASRDGLKVFALARKLGVPVMVHTGAGIPFANPANLIDIALRYPDVNIVMAHCGMMIMAGEAAIALRAAGNLYADITWTAGFNLRHWCEEFGAHRFLFGSDHADNAGTEIAKVKTCGLTEDDQAWIFSRSAEKLYKLAT